MNSNFYKRTLSALTLFPLLVLLILKGSSLFLLGILFLCLFIAWWEWIQLFNFSLLKLLYGFFILALSIFMIPKTSPFYAIFLILTTSFLPHLNTFNTETFKKDFFPFFLGIIYLFLGFYSLKVQIESYPREFLLFFFCAVFANDTGAYLTGKFWGKSPFFPEISPKKTWEGFFGGLLLTFIVSFILNSLFSLWSTLSLITLTLMITFFAVIGDLFESSIKRMVGKKDSGIIIPGHGGLLDRIDGVLFAAPLYLFFLEVLNYGINHRMGL